MKSVRPQPNSAPGTQPSIWIGTRSLSEASAAITTASTLVRRRRLFLLVWVLGFVACGAIYGKVIPRDFIATTQILLQPRFIMNDGPEDLRHFHQSMMDSEQCETELRVLRS